MVLKKKKVKEILWLYDQEEVLETTLLIHG